MIRSILSRTLPCLMFLALSAAAEDTGLMNSVDCSDLPHIKADAETGDAKAELTLGKLYMNGHCVPDDGNEGAKWIALSAKQGYTPAQVTGAALFYRGGFYGDAASLAQLAANKGDAGSQFLLAYLYEHGKGLVQNNDKAAYWAKLSAEQGDAGAQAMLGTFYAQGIGVHLDNIEAEKWYILSSKKKTTDNNLAELKKYVETLLSKQELVEAHKRAEDWRPHSAQ